jgi:hypothetical protein
MSDSTAFGPGYKKEHTKQRPGKSYGQNSSKPGNSGASDRPAHKHPDKMVALGEGLNLGSVHSAHTKMPVREVKHNPAPRKAGHAQHNRAVAGGADPTGMSPAVASQRTGPGGTITENPGVRTKARAFNVRSEAGNADPSAFADGQ